jgi:hypothetical protein
MEEILARVAMNAGPGPVVRPMMTEAVSLGTAYAAEQRSPSGHISGGGLHGSVGLSPGRWTGAG